MEDVCYPGDAGVPENCLTLPSVCLPVGTSSMACRAAMSVQFKLEGSGQQQGARSMVHADSTYLLAQAAGFSPDDAWWITAFDEVCDYGKFQAYDMHAQPLDPATQTPTLNGFVRTNTATGGTFFHYVSTYNGGSGSASGSLDGLDPDVTDESTEFFLAHLRAWAQAGSGPSRVLCTGGLTTMADAGSYGTGADCYPYDAGADAGPDAGNILWSTAIFAAGPAITANNSSGLQVIEHSDGGAPVLSDQFDEIVGLGADAGASASAKIMDARLGIYLHALADRISHNVCTDTASMAGPSGEGWTESWTTGKCDQGYHVLFHAWETGEDFSQVPAENQTTVSALNAVHGQLLSFASARGVSPIAADAGSLLADMATALQTPEATARIEALATVSCKYGLKPFPGAPPCATPVTKADDGGTADAAVDATIMAAPPPPSSATSSSCSAGSGGRANPTSWAAALALLVLAAFGIRSRRRSTGSLGR
jgi:MYXO-CTERM domain-containing protein